MDFLWGLVTHILKTFGYAIQQWLYWFVGLVLFLGLTTILSGKKDK